MTPPRSISIDKLPRRRLAFLPTPIVELQRLRKAVDGPRLLMKRDDQTGLAMGGNKTRKLEFLIADALERGCDTVITAGAAQSNHCRQTAAAAASAGLECHLALGGQPGRVAGGNLLLDGILGATVHWTGDERKGERIAELAERLAAAGAKPYVVPYGGSNAIGALGYVRAMQELARQLDEQRLTVDRIVFATSSGGTYAGMKVGAELIGFGGQLVGIGIDKPEAGEEQHEVVVSRIANETAVRLGIARRFTAEEILVKREFCEAGYGVVGSCEKQAIRLAAREEGILLDPVYTGRAMGGLLELIRSGEISSGETILFWHTGGTPALFQYAAELDDDS